MRWLTTVEAQSGVMKSGMWQWVSILFARESPNSPAWGCSTQAAAGTPPEALAMPQMRLRNPMDVLRARYEIVESAHAVAVLIHLVQTTACLQYM